MATKKAPPKKAARWPAGPPKKAAKAKAPVKRVRKSKEVPVIQGPTASFPPFDDLDDNRAVSVWPYRASRVDPEWVVSERTFLTWEPLFVFSSKSAADENRRSLEESTGMLTKYKVSRVTRMG